MGVLLQSLFIFIYKITSAFKNDICTSFTGNNKAKFDIIFPSLREVNESHLGPNGAGVFFLQERSYTMNDYLKESLCNLMSPNNYPEINGHLSHSKVLILHTDYQIDDNTIIFIGSHNLSPAAWGKYEKKESQIYIKNYELGIIFLPRENSKSDKIEIISRLPFRFPPLKYKRDDRPWFINSDMQE